MKITTVGIDLAKTVIQVHAIDEHGRAAVKKALKRDQVTKYFANLPPCLIGMEACGSAHHWARQVTQDGHTVKVMAPQYVKPYVKTNKNDAADAEAICEAVGRPNMRFVAAKNIEQQTVLSLHAVRQGFVKARTAQSNQIRGLLAEFGIVINRGFNPLYEQLPAMIEDGENGLPGVFRQRLTRLLDHLKALDRQVGEVEREILLWHRHNEASCRLAERSRDRPADRERDRGHAGQWAAIPEWAAIRRGPRYRAATAFERRQTDLAGHQQARRQVPAH